jgi:hypothetical protein
MHEAVIGLVLIAIAWITLRPKRMTKGRADIPRRSALGPEDKLRRGTASKGGGTARRVGEGRE